VKHYGRTLRKRREELALTQAELSKLSGIDQTVISRLETETRKMVSAQAEAILKALFLELTLIKVGKKKRK
jgi:predicted transcriptional regulator